jgi:hypothetical protein
VIAAASIVHLHRDRPLVSLKIPASNETLAGNFRLSGHWAQTAFGEITPHFPEGLQGNLLVRWGFRNSVAPRPASVKFRRSD